MISIPYLSSIQRSTVPQPPPQATSLRNPGTVTSKAAPPVAGRERAAYGLHYGAVVVAREGEAAVLVLCIAPWAVQAEHEKAKREAERHEAALAEGDGQ